MSIAESAIYLRKIADSVKDLEFTSFTPTYVPKPPVSSEMMNLMLEDPILAQLNQVRRELQATSSYLPTLSGAIQHVTKFYEDVCAYHEKKSTRVFVAIAKLSGKQYGVEDAAKAVAKRTQGKQFQEYVENYFSQAMRRNIDVPSEFQDMIPYLSLREINRCLSNTGLKMPFDTIPDTASASMDAFVNDVKTNLADLIRKEKELAEQFNDYLENRIKENPGMGAIAKAQLSFTPYSFYRPENP